MSTHFKWYPAEAEVVVPWNARYSFPSQANKAIKMTPRIPPKNNSTFSPGNVIRVEFPAQGYVNPGKTTLEFDITMSYIPGATEQFSLRFQNNIQSIFSRVRLLYGSTPLEDIPNYNAIIRSVTEWTSSGRNDQFSITDGIGNTVAGFSGQYAAAAAGASTGLSQMVNVRQKYIQGMDDRGIITDNDATKPNGFGVVPVGTATGTLLSAPAITGINPVRRYQVQLSLGLLQQEKLIPTKFMASQLAIELTLANPTECMYYVTYSAANTVGTTPPTYSVTNVNLIPEILEFDASYDESFLKGLQSGGVPIKFCTWNNYRFGVTGGTANLQIQERSRSVKAIFAMLRRDQGNFAVDNGATFFTNDVSQTGNTFGYTGSSVQDYQFRIGGRYFPASPVQCTTTVGGNIPNGGSEAYVELAKACNILGDYRVSTSTNATRWALPAGATTATAAATILQEYDYDYALVGFKCGGNPVVVKKSTATAGLSGDLGTQCFGMAIDLETSNGLEISGLNAEEQSDISLIARYSQNQVSSGTPITPNTDGTSTGFTYDVFTYIDSMIVLRENNVLELIQ